MHKISKEDNLNGISTFITLVNALDNNITPENVKRLQVQKNKIMLQVEGKAPQHFKMNDAIKTLAEDFEAEVEAIHNLGV